MYSVRLARRQSIIEYKYSILERRLIKQSGQVVSLPSYNRKSRQRDRRYARDVVNQSVFEWLHDSQKPAKQKRYSRGQSVNPTNKSHSLSRQTHSNASPSLSPTRRSVSTTRITRRKADDHHEVLPSSFPTRITTDHFILQKNDLHRKCQSLVNIPQTVSGPSVIENKQCSCQVTMTYQSDTTLSIDSHDTKRDEVTVYQEFNSGFTSIVFKGFLKTGDAFSFKSQRSINDRFRLIICVNDLVDSCLSACCEYKYQDGTRIGGDDGLFWIHNIDGARPCGKCLEDIEMSFKSPSRDSGKAISSISRTSSQLRLPLIYANQSTPEIKSMSVTKSTTGYEASESRMFTTRDIETDNDEYRPISITPLSSVSIPINNQLSSSSSSSTSTNLKWSAQIPAEESPSTNTISKKSEIVVAQFPMASIEPSTPLSEPPTLIPSRITGDVENFCIAWIGGSNQENNIILLRPVVNFIRVFDDIDALNTFLTGCIHSKVIILLSYDKSQSVIHQIHTITCIYSIYLLSNGKYEGSDWTKNYHKIVGIYQNIESIRVHLLQTLPQISSSSLISVITSTDSSTTSDTSFIYCQLLKETMLCHDDESDLKKDLLEFCRLHYANNPDEMKNINDFETEFIPQKAIWWYTRNCFLGKILNRAFRTQEIDLLFKMRYIMQCLHTELKSIAMSKIITVYAVLEIPFDDAMNLQKNINGLLLFGTFLPAMFQQPQSLNLNDKSKQISITFSINLGSGCGATVKHLCAADSNIDVLINIDTIFRIHSVEKVNERHWNVSLQSISHTDHQFKQLTDSLRTIIEAPVVLLQVSKLLLATDHYAECDYLAELLFTDQSLRGDPTLLASLAAVHHLLGNTDDERGDSRTASKQFFKSIRAFQIFLPSDHPLMSASYNNIGSMYFKENDYDEAIKFHRKALDCQLKSASPDTDAIATYSNNIGAVYFAQGNYSEGLKHLHRAATILEKLSSEEKIPNLCLIYQKIAASYWRMDKGKEALEYYKKTLNVQLTMLPLTTHQISVTYFNLSTAYARVGQIDEAVISAEKSVEQLLKIFPPDHPEVKENQVQLEIVRQKQWLQQVLSS